MNLYGSVRKYWKNIGSPKNGVKRVSPIWAGPDLVTSRISHFGRPRWFRPKNRFLGFFHLALDFDRSVRKYETGPDQISNKQFHIFLQHSPNERARNFDQKIDFWDFSIWPLILTVLQKEWNWGNVFDTIFRASNIFSIFSYGTVQLNQNLGHRVSFLWLFHREMNGVSWFFYRNEWFAPPKENARRARGARRFTKSFQLMT